MKNHLIKLHKYRSQIIEYSPGGKISLDGEIRICHKLNLVEKINKGDVMNLR